MAQLKNVVEPFGEVNVYAKPGGLRVVATILMEPRREGTQTGIALDGSASMADAYGVPKGPPNFLAGLLGKKKPEAVNQVMPVARAVCAYLARKLDADGGTTCVYWATGPGGGQVEVVGDLTADQAERYAFGPPRDFGTGTQLLPAVRYFVDRFADAPWGFYAFVTDGELHDLEAVKAYSTRLAHEVAAGRRRPVKFVLIGVGSGINERQMEELDDLETGTGVDLWDHKIAAEMRHVQDIFAEVVDRNARVADRGRILDPSGRVVRDYSDSGVPALLEFGLPAGTAYFTLEVEGHKFHQPLAAGVAVPPPEAVEVPLADVVEEPPPVAEEAPGDLELGPLASDADPAPGINLEFTDPERAKSLGIELGKIDEGKSGKPDRRPRA
jgi:hypothetical protein